MMIAYGEADEGYAYVGSSRKGCSSDKGTMLLLVPSQQAPAHGSVGPSSHYLLVLMVDQSSMCASLVKS